MILNVPRRLPTYVHSQVSPSAEWVVMHFLGKYPSVETVDGDKAGIMGKVVYTNANELRIQFSVPVSGTAYLN